MRRLGVFLLIVVLLSTAVVARAQEPLPAEAPPVAPEFFARGRAALDDQNYEQAVADFSLFILFNPRSARAYYVRGLSYGQLGEVEQAVDDLSRALDYAGDLPDLRAAIVATRAEFYAAMGQMQRALADFNDLIATNPTPQAYANRALVYLAQANFAGAVSDLDQAISQVDGEQPALYYYRARAKSALFDDEEAAGDYLAWVNGIQEQTSAQEPMQPGDSLTLEFAPSLVHRIPFSASADDALNITAANLTGDADPLMVIVDADGLALIGNDETARSGTSAVVAGFHVPRDGEFNLLVTHSITGYSGRVVVSWQAQ